MNTDQFQQFVVEKLMAIEHRLSTVEAKAALIGSAGGALAGLVTAFITKHFAS